MYVLFQTILHGILFPIDYYEEFMKHYPQIPQMVDFPSDLANSLVAAGFITKKQTDAIVKETGGPPSINFTFKLLQKVKIMMCVCKNDPQKIREWMIKLCSVLKEQDTASLSELAELLMRD